ncbi:OprD family outer membrane porin [Nitrosophilus alvini]|uniref:OprD family outer membrane porin n=1 Tax=Nitrosophilus alvini TaxID=2714855 RepID=UPI00190E1FDF|nr:OprD family outer membrane porin [Nitrosophilus alvini]
MRSSLKYISIAAAALLALQSDALYAQDLPKRALKTNGQLIYYKTPGIADNIAQMFTEGMFYGRLRSNTFYYKWEKETENQDSHFITGVGGSLIFKSASFADIDFTTGLYYSKAYFDAEKNPAERLKAGKDLFSRFDYINSGKKSMALLGEAYIRYTGISKTELKIGRQLVETFYTKSNDTKMIPNTFDGIVIDTKAIPDSTVRLAYLTKQKLRDHTKTHSLLMYGDSNLTSLQHPEWSQNDDSAMHKGLTYSRLKVAGVDTQAPLITGDIHNKTFENLKLNASFYTVPELISEVMAEANYKIDMGTYSLTPGVRYIKQFDKGAGKIGGAAYNGSLAGKTGAAGGYKEADSLDSQMIAARLVTRYQNYKLNIGYTHVFDEADLITPWRGFPTSGYTRSMARYNWQANTKSYRIELVRNANSKGIYKKIFTQFSFLHTDADEKKGYYDENYYYAGFVQNLPGMVNLQWRLRLGYNDTKKPDADSLDARFEINYIF